MTDPQTAVVLQCDRNYLFALAVAVASLDEVHRSESLELFVAGEGFDEADRWRVESLVSFHSVRWLEIDSSALDDIPVGPGLHRAALSRFLLADSIPESVGRVLYLDVDLLVRADLGDLLATSLDGDQVVAAVRDAYVGTFWGPR